MSLAKECKIYFDSVVRDRGKDYFRRDKATIVYADKMNLSATVAGTDIYDVDLVWVQKDPKAGVIEANCDCPYFYDGDLCKHIWCVLLDVDSRRPDFVAALPSTVKVKMKESDAEFEFEDFFDEDYNEPPRGRGRQLNPASPLPRSKPTWRDIVEEVVDVSDRRASSVLSRYYPQPKRRNILHAPKRLIWYSVNYEVSSFDDGLPIRLYFQERNKKGEWGKIKAFYFDNSFDFNSLVDEHDRDALRSIFGASFADNEYQIYSRYEKFNYIQLRYDTLDLFLPLLQKTGRFVFGEPVQGGKNLNIEWDPKEIWQLRFNLKVQESKNGKPTKAPKFVLWAELRMEQFAIDIDHPAVIIGQGAALFADRIVRVHPLNRSEDELMEALRQFGPLEIPQKDLNSFVSKFYSLPEPPILDFPVDFPWKVELSEPQPVLSIDLRQRGAASKSVSARIFFDYPQGRVKWLDPDPPKVDASAKTVSLRNHVVENQLLQAFFDHGWISATPGNMDADCSFVAKDVSKVISQLLEQNWIVEASGKAVKKPGIFDGQIVSTGIDWFDLHGGFNYDQDDVSLPDILAAVKNGEEFIRLGDGSVGLLPEVWLRKFRILAEMGKVNGKSLRFEKPKAALLDVLLCDSPEVSYDQSFQKLQDKLRRCAVVAPQQPLASFRGQMRHYQQDGLGWLRFLAETGFGGCLADDMGLGKTIQALAHLQYLKSKSLESTSESSAKRCSLIVVPRSLVDNWLRECRQFTPDLNFIEYGTVNINDALQQCDALVITYGMLRRDILKLKDIEFLAVILDEAQAIKNASSQTAKAVRLLRAEHRLALSGTPVENHLGEIGSLMEFLNPGMLSLGSLKKMMQQKSEYDKEAVELLGKALRPFILRRTKEGVLQELPPKTEQLIFCEMSRPQHQEYAKVQKHYQAQLLKKVSSEGINKSKIHVLEALLRLRQLACHPGLVDKKLIDQDSAKIEVLEQHLEDIITSDHKALIFSQFTSLLAIVKSRLDQKGIKYEYLDGQTRDRQACVERFQDDKNCKVFLLSLKAGGLGLNLTAADYCFILDPWWNPAIEAQAIDRTHRMGQKRSVFAYRLIAKGTVEEKILELQSKKRQLAEGLIADDASILSNLKFEDLQMLLS